MEKWIDIAGSFSFFYEMVSNLIQQQFKTLKSENSYLPFMLKNLFINYH